MLSSDNIILEILNKSKQEGNRLLNKFKIGYPAKELAQESNLILVAVVSSENQLDGFDFDTFKDLIEILVITKQNDNMKAINIIKTVSYEICKLIMQNADKFPNKPVIRNINPYFDVDMTLSRGQIMVNVVTDPTDFLVDDETYDNVCRVLEKK